MGRAAALNADMHALGATSSCRRVGAAATSIEVEADLLTAARFVVEALHVLIAPNAAELALALDDRRRAEDIQRLVVGLPRLLVVCFLFKPSGMLEE